ncbi:tyrosine-type recombinase/integrase [Terasakiella sp.]|uniref:tyrosine-type recombinase/integrase n=1 Tax=Terasakiella sp. TaxID=2034861 RepID=UPI003AA7F5C3
MARMKLTKRNVAAIKPHENKRLYVYDTELTGFGLMVTPKGSKSYFAEYRNGVGRGASTRRVTLGSTLKLLPDEARDLAKLTIADAAKGEDPAMKKKEQREAITVAALCDIYEERHVKIKLKVTTQELYRHILQNHIKPRLGTKRAINLRKQDVAFAHLSMKDTPSIANSTLAVIGSMFAWADKHGYVPEAFNPATRIEKFKEQKRERFLTTEELERLGAAIREGETDGIPYEVDESKPTSKHAPKTENRGVLLSPHVAGAIRLLILTGARLREILTLQWGHVDLERGILLLPDSKTGKKTIILNAPAQQIIAGLPRIGKYVIASDSAGQAEEKPRADLKRPWSTVTRRAGLEGVRIHDLRHTHASFGVGASFGLPIVGKLLGHTQLRTTERYAHLETDPLRRASNSIGNSLAAAMGEKPLSDNVIGINDAR